MHVPPALAVRSRDHLYDRVIHIADFSVTLLGVVDRIAGSPGRALDLMGEVDGVDHTEFLWSTVGAMTHDVAHHPDPCTSTVLEFNAPLMHCAFLEGDYKHILGNVGRDKHFKEPTSEHYDADERRNFVIQETVCDWWNS